MPVDPTQLAFLAIVLGAYFVGTVLGFGTTILVLTFGAQLVELDVLLPIVSPLNICLGGYLAARHHRNIRWRLLLRRFLPSVGLGVPFGLLLFNLRELTWLRLGFGVLVVILAGLQLRAWLVAKGAAGDPIRGLRGLGLLFFGGVVHGVYATGGPLIVYVMGREIDDKGAFRSTVSALFLPMTTALIVDYVLIGLYTREVVELGLLSAVPVVLGLVLGEWAHRRINDRSFRLAVWLLLLAGGLVLVGRALLSP
ncbi:MAG: sulfite exporter TauE/SafE family protein [Deltaproteobacteria bacterium]|nr:sulfite exporter TauE/SafE family protein [Deltaproteobacteria bacterium]